MEGGLRSYEANSKYYLSVKIRVLRPNLSIKMRVLRTNLSVRQNLSVKMRVGGWHKVTTRDKVSKMTLPTISRNFWHSRPSSRNDKIQLASSCNKVIIHFLLGRILDQISTEWETYHKLCQESKLYYTQMEEYRKNIAQSLKEGFYKIEHSQTLKTRGVS